MEHLEKHFLGVCRKIIHAFCYYAQKNSIFAVETLIKEM
jgi:hypothetical protein